MTTDDRWELVMGAARDAGWDHDTMRQWLDQPAPALAHRKPAEVMGTDEGAEQVANVIKAIAEGIYL